MTENAVILINKPQGMTSFAVTSAIRRRLGVKKAGHAGTLDPLACGVLPIMTGRATKLIDLIPDGKKRYIAAFMLGFTTDTLDCEGEVLTEQPVNVTPDEIESAANSFCGEISQIPPMYSALSSGGKKLYQLAREGVTVERQARRATIYDINLVRLERFEDTYIGELDITCSKGTYIRTLIDDMGSRLHCGAVMTALRRISSNGFDISDCVDFDEFMHSENPQAYLMPPDIAVRGYGRINVSQAQSVRFSNGGELDLMRIKAKSPLCDNEIYRIYCGDKFLGLGIAKDGSLRPKCVF